MNEGQEGASDCGDYDQRASFQSPLRTLHEQKAVDSRGLGHRRHGGWNGVMGNLRLLCELKSAPHPAKQRAAARRERGPSVSTSGSRS